MNKGFKMDKLNGNKATQTDNSVAKTFYNQITKSGHRYFSTHENSQECFNSTSKSAKNTLSENEIPIGIVPNDWYAINPSNSETEIPISSVPNDWYAINSEANKKEFKTTVPASFLADNSKKIEA